ncbi:MAG: hypothetical protein AMXMBFR58_24610 [Phycisphaerae bacterium]
MLPTRPCCLLLCGITADEIPGPLMAFQATTLDKKDMFRLVRSLTARSDRLVDDARLARWFEGTWNQLSEGIRRDMASHAPLVATYNLGREPKAVCFHAAYMIHVDAHGIARFAFTEDKLYLKQPKEGDLSARLYCKSDSELESMRFESEWVFRGFKRLSTTQVQATLQPRAPIQALVPFKHTFSWTPPLVWGDHADSVSVPVEVPTREISVHVTSALPMKRVIAFCDREPTAEDIPKRALEIADYGCPEASLLGTSELTWRMEYPRAPAIYRLVIYW